MDKSWESLWDQKTSTKYLESVAKTSAAAVVVATEIT